MWSILTDDLWWGGAWWKSLPDCVIRPSNITEIFLVLVWLCLCPSKIARRWLLNVIGGCWCWKTSLIWCCALLLGWAVGHVPFLWAPCELLRLYGNLTKRAPIYAFIALVRMLHIVVHLTWTGTLSGWWSSGAFFKSRIWKEGGVAVDVEENSTYVISCDGLWMCGGIIEQLSHWFRRGLCAFDLFFCDYFKCHYHCGFGRARIIE